MPGVFLDTSVVRQHNFDVWSAPFETLATLAREGVITLLLPDITREEIRAGVAEVIDEFEVALRGTTTKGRILALSGAEGLLDAMKTFDAQATVAAANERIDAYFEYARAVVLQAAHGPAGQVFADYFGRRPPFGKGKKKAEFPDAFVIAELIRWSDREGQPVLVISQDGDLEAVCSGVASLSYTTSLPGAVGDLLRDRSILARRLSAALQTEGRELTRSIADTIFDEGISLADIPDGETGDLTVHNVALDDVAVVEATADSAVVQANAVIELELEASYADPNSYYYDSEDKQGYYLGSVEQRLHRSLNVPVEFEVSVDPEAPEFYVVKRTTINRGAPLEVYVDEDAETHWK